MRGTIISLVILLLSLTSCATPNKHNNSPLNQWWKRLAYAPKAMSAPAPEFIRVPVQGIKTKHIANTFGGPRSNGRKHEGTDIFAAIGTPVLAAAEGMVVQVGTNNLGGQVVMVWGYGDRYYYYAHLSKFANIQVGDMVKAGDVVGYVGLTGNAFGTPPHLHFGVYTSDWQAINPWPLLRDAGQGEL